jgi:DNA-binding transcriptional ArsR family regulator
MVRPTRTSGESLRLRARGEMGQQRDGTQRTAEEKKTSASKKASRAQGRARANGKRPKRSSGELVDCRQMHALSIPERVRALAVIAEQGVASPKEISTTLKEGLSGVSYHVKVLREAGLIELDHEVPRRGAVEHFYKVVAPTLIPPDAWRNLPPALVKNFSLDILREFLDDALASMKAGVFDDPAGEMSWTPLILDSLGVQEVGHLTRGFLASVFEVQDGASKRLSEASEGSKKAVSTTVFLASFLSTRSPSEGKKASATRKR